MSRSPDRIPRDRLFAYLREYETDNGFIPREHDIFRSLMYDFAKDRHIPARCWCGCRSAPASGDEEVKLAVAYIYELIKECYDLPTRSFLFRVALFLEDRILITRGLEIATGEHPGIQPEYATKGDKAVLVISIAALMLTLIWLLTTAIPAILQ